VKGGSELTEPQSSQCEEKKMMMKRMTVSALIAVLLATVIAVPADAKAPTRGWMDLDFNAGFMKPLATCPQVTWFGDIEIDGVTYGMWFQPTGRVDTGQVFHFEESWFIYERESGDLDGEFTECETDAVVMRGIDAGIGAPNLKAVANGTVEWVAEDGGLDTGLIGRNVHWSGQVSDSMLEFAGPFRVN
jgi:hypothetical protein